MAKETQFDDVNLVARLRDSSTCREAFGEVIRIYSEPLYLSLIPI